MDRLNAAARSRNMRAIRGRDTLPERRVRSALHRAGFRFRINRADLPGKPDIVLPRLRTAVFVHGCFWHGHGCRRGGTGPKSNTGYWTPKLARTRERDARNEAALRHLGWRVVTVWECGLTDLPAVVRAITEQGAPLPAGG